MSLALITFTISLFSLTFFLGIKRIEHTSDRTIVPQRIFTKSDYFFHCVLIRTKRFFRTCFRSIFHLGLILGKGVRRIRRAVAAQIFALADLVSGKADNGTSQTTEGSNEN